MLLSPKAITLQHPRPIIRHHHTGSRPPGLVMSPSSNRRTIDIAKRCLLQQSSTAGKKKDKGHSVGIPALRRISISDIAKTNGVPRDTVYKHLAKSNPLAILNTPPSPVRPHSPKRTRDATPRYRKNAHTSSAQHARM